MADSPQTLQEAYQSLMAGINQQPEAPAEEVQTEVQTEQVAQPEAQPEVPAEVEAPAQTDVQTEPTVQPTQPDPYQMMSQQTEALRNATVMVQQMQSQNQALNQEIERLRSALDEQNQAAEVSEIRQAVTPPAPPQIPTLDELAYLDEEGKAARQNEYASAMAEFIKGQAMADLQPFIEKAKQAEALEAEELIISKLSSPESGYADFAEYLPMIMNIAKNNPLLAGAETGEDKFLTAYAVAKGIKANEPVAPKTKLTDEDLRLLGNEQLLEIYRSNPEFQRLVAQEQMQKAKETGEVPTFSASGDAANVALNPTEKPKNLADAKKTLMSLFRH